MSYGLYDGDLILYPKIPFFNLELMKLSTYYKRRREIVSFSPTFSPNMYSHFIVRQDYPSRTPYSSAYTNIEYGGRVFDGEKYKPLPLEIELLKPNTELYNKIETQKVINNSTKSSFNVMRRAEHVRLSLDGKTINPSWEKQLRRERGCYGLIFHDYDLGAIDGSYELIKENLSEIISNQKGRRLGMKFPVQVSTENEFCNWLEFLALNQYYSLQYNGILTADNIERFKELRQNSTSQIQTSINITKNISYDNFITDGIVQCFKTMLDLRRQRIVFPLIYDKDFFIDNRWREIVDLICRFNKHSLHNIDESDYFKRVVPYETFFGYMKNLTKKDIIYGSIYPKEKAIELFQFVREQNYELFYLFYEYTGELK